MSFDAQAWIAAHEPPTYKDITGAVHTGRLWSHVEYLKWLKVFEAWQEKPLSDEEYEKELRRLIGSMGFTESVVEEMLGLPSVALEEMVASFFVLQRSGRKPQGSSTLAPPPPSASSPKIGPASESSAS